MALVWLWARFLGPRLILDLSSGKVTWHQMGLFGSAVRWTLAREDVDTVCLSMIGNGVVCVFVRKRNGESLIVDSGINEGELRALAADLSGCWEVPMKDG